MKKLMCVLTFVLLFTGLLCGSWARVLTLGGELSMLVDDDVGIDLFPQRINDFNLVRIEDIGFSPGYLAILGEDGDKWGIWGTRLSANDILNVYRSLSTTSAVELSLLLHRKKDVNENNTEEMERVISNFESYITYGWDHDNSEKSLMLGLSYGPGDRFYMGEVYNSFDYTDFATIDSAKTSGSASSFDIWGVYRNRTREKFLIFDNYYDRAEIGTFFGGHDITQGGTKTEEEKCSGFYLRARRFMFNIKDINENTRLYYGHGCGLGYYLDNVKDEVGDTKTTYHSLYFGRMVLAAGLEMEFKKFDFRMGLNRYNTLFYNEGDKFSNAVTRENSLTEISHNADYWINTGIGYKHNNLQINTVFNSNIWSNGPQMLFDSNTGFIFTSLDIIYNLK